MIPIQCYSDPKKKWKWKVQYIVLFKNFIENEKYNILYLLKISLKMKSTKYCTFQILHSKWEVQCYVHFKIIIKN